MRPVAIHSGPGDRDRFAERRKSGWRKAKQSTWWRTLTQAQARWVDEDGDQRAAAFAYYLLLSLLPLGLLLVAAGSLFA